VVNELQSRERAQKRGGGRVVTGAELENCPDAESAAGLDLLCSEMVEMLDVDLRSFALLRLMGYKNREIAREFGCTERKVERKLQLVRAVWEEEIRRWHE
jgi:DNA-directed RNA polymerase specialized sigma24 family protein